jgi:hypothetical protein
MILVAIAALAAEGEVLRRRSVSSRQIAASHAALAASERLSAAASHAGTFVAIEHLAMAEFHDRLADRWNAAASRPWSSKAWAEICAVHSNYHRRKWEGGREAEREALAKIRDFERTLADLRRRRAEGSFICDDALLRTWEEQIARERMPVAQSEFRSRTIAKYEAAASHPWVPIETDPPEPR